METILDFRGIPTKGPRIRSIFTWPRMFGQCCSCFPFSVLDFVFDPIVLNAFDASGYIHCTGKYVSRDWSVDIDAGSRQLECSNCEIRFISIYIGCNTINAIIGKGNNGKDALVALLASKVIKNATLLFPFVSASPANQPKVVLY